MEIFDSIFPSSMEAFFADFLYAKYAAAFFGVFLAAGITFWLIRRISDLIIGAVLIGAFLFVCYGLANGSISTWGEVIGASVGLGIVASIISIPVLPFSGSLMSQYGRSDQSTPLKENSQEKSQIKST